MWTAVIFLIVIGIAAAARRTVVLLFPGTLGGGSTCTCGRPGYRIRTPRVADLDPHLPGALFLGLAAFQFVPDIRQKHLQFHRWSGRGLVVTGLVIGVSALVMSFKMNIGGVNETAATTFYAIVFLICLVRAYLFIRRKDVVRHREWMIRAYAVGLGVATTRPFVGIFFALRRMTPHEFFGIAFWLGFTITFVAAEAWIDYTRYRGRSRVEQDEPTRGEVARREAHCWFDFAFCAASEMSSIQASLRDAVPFLITLSRRWKRWAICGCLFGATRLRRTRQVIATPSI